MKYLTPAAAGAAYDCGARRIQKLADQARIPGAKRHGHAWLIPADFTVLPPPKRKRKPAKLPGKVPA